MSEFKPQHDVSKSGRMAFAEGPEGECVDVFDVMRWLVHSGACGDISPAIQTTTDKLHVAVAGGCTVYPMSAAENLASPGISWARPVGDADVVRPERRGGWVPGAVTPRFENVEGIPVIRRVHAPGHHRPYLPALVGPAGAIEWLGELLAKCVSLDAFNRGTAHRDVPHFGIRRADAVALFGYPRASTGEAQVAQAGGAHVAAHGSGKERTDPNASARAKALEMWRLSDQSRGVATSIARKVGHTPRCVHKWIEAENKRLAKLAKEGKPTPKKSDGADLAKTWRPAVRPAA